MKKRMVRLTAIVLACGMIFALGACGSKDATPAEGQATEAVSEAAGQEPSDEEASEDAGESAGMANPWVEYPDMEQACNAAGFSFNVPETVSSYVGLHFSVMNNELIQVVYGEPDKGVTIRKAEGSEDISGDYNTYSDEKEVDINGTTVKMSGNDGLISLAIWEKDEAGREGRTEMASILSQMQISFTEKESDSFVASDLVGIKTAVLSVTDLSILGSRLSALLDWVMEGHSLLFLYPPYNEAAFLSIAPRLGITVVENAPAKGEALHFTKEIMPGCSRDLSVTDPYESSLEVTLDDACEVFLEASGVSQTPLLWRRALGKGRVVFDNLNFLEKAYRGFHCAAYSLLGDTCIWPVINGSTYFIDDFPSPVPEGDSQFIQQDYGMDIKDFYTHHWWKDVYNLAKKYNIRYTGLVIEDYSAQVSGTFPRNKDVQRFQYFGNMLLREGGELGFHGYNHMPLVPENFDYLGLYDSYRQWVSVNAMRNSLTELSEFCHELFPEEEFTVYVPPSNIISEEGRVLLAEDVAVNAEIMMMVLSMREMDADLAENGRIALEKFAGSEPGYYDAILMDMRMPEMDGLEATRAIRALDRPDAKTIPIIALTANAFDEDVQRSLQAGLNAHLSKPVEPENLFQTLESLIPS